MEQMDLLHIVGGNVEGSNHFGKHLAVFIKLNITLHYDPTSRYLYKRNESLCLQKDLNLNIQSSSIYKRQKLETAQMFLKSSADKRIMEYNGFLLKSQTKMDYIHIP